MRVLVLIFSLFCSIVFAHGQTVFPAKSTGAAETLTIYSSLDEGVARPLMAAFQQRYPNVEVQYYDLQSLEIYERVIDESDDQGATADLLLSSAMDLQVKLTNDGYAENVGSLVSNWPSWAKWRNSAFGLTFEPSVIVYHKPSFEGLKPPANRAELIDLLTGNGNRFYRRAATYDIERSGLGFLFLVRDQEHDRNIWRLMNAMGSAGVKLYSNSSSILERVADGRLSLGYNILGSYAQTWLERFPDLGIILPEDFTVVMSRIAIVPKAARRPQLGRQMLSFLTSVEGQTIMATDLKLPALHPQVTGENTASSFREKFRRRLRPIPIGPGLVAYLDQVKRARLIDRWNKSLRGE
ncbi:MAG: ABC transporter substrate-binding protein [Rhizobiaceae bacterium]